MNNEHHLPHYQFLFIWVENFLACRMNSKRSRPSICGVEHHLYERLGYFFYFEKLSISRSKLLELLERVLELELDIFSPISDIYLMSSLMSRELSFLAISFPAALDLADVWLI